MLTRFSRPSVPCLALGLVLALPVPSRPQAFVTEPIDAGVSSLAGDEVSIVLNSQDEPAIAYVGNNQELRLARRLGSTWTGTATAPPQVHKIHSVSLAFDPQGNAHVAYEHQCSSVNTHDLMYTVFDGVSWSAHQYLVQDDGNQVGGGVSLAIGEDGVSRLAFQHEGMGIRSGYLDPGWNLCLQPLSTNSTKVIDLALDAAGAPAAVFANVASVRFVSRTGSPCAWSAVTPVGSDNAAELALAFDPTGLAHLCYNVAGGALTYATSSDPGNSNAWTFDPFAPGSVTCCDLAVDDAGAPHLVYATTTPSPGRVTYATLSGGSWQVTEVDSVAANRVSIAVTGDGLPHIAYAAGSTLTYARQAVPVISVDVQDLGGGQYEWQVEADVVVTGVSGQFRRGGETSYRPMNAFTKQGGLWVSPFPATDVTLRGFDYYLVTQGWIAQHGDAQSPKHLAVTRNGVSGPLPEPLAWRMVSAPMLVTGNGDTPGLLTPFFGPVGESGWLLGDWSPGTGTYQTIGVQTNLGFESGRAYWLGVTKAAAWSLSGRSAFPARDSCFAVSLAPGWNMVGNPASYRVSLDPSVLQIDDGTTRDTFANQAALGVVSPDIFTYARTLTPPYQLASSGMDAWSGCWIRNTTAPPVTITLLIPATESVAREAARVKPAPERLLSIDASGAGEHARVEIGLQAGAADGRDPWDIDQPPGVPDQALSLGLAAPGAAGDGRPGELLFRDVRSPGESVAWRLLVSSPEGPTELTWIVPDVLASTSLRLHDGVRSWDLNRVRSVTLGSGRHDLRLVAGVDTEGGVMAPLADGLSLRLSPNPLRGEAAIQVSIPATGDVRLDVYDVRGRRVWHRLLPNRTAGEHALLWSGVDGDESPLATGVYFLRAETGPDARSVQKFTILR